MVPESEASSVQHRTSVRVAYVKLVNMVLNVHRNRKAYWGRGERGGEWYGGGEGWVGEGNYIPIATLSPPE